MHVAVFPAQAIENSAHRISDAACQQPDQAGNGDCLEHRVRRQHHAPAHADVADHGKHGVLLQINGGKDDRHDRNGPHPSEQRPAPGGIAGPDGAQRDGRIGTRDKQVDGTVVQHLHHLFGHFRQQSVIYAGHGVEKHHGHTVYHAAYDGPGIALQDGGNQAQHQCDNPECAAHNMRYHVEDLFSTGVIRQLPVFQAGPFHACLPRLNAPQALLLDVFPGSVVGAGVGLGVGSGVGSGVGVTGGVACGSITSA